VASDVQFMRAIDQESPSTPFAGIAGKGPLAAALNGVQTLADSEEPQSARKRIKRFILPS